MLAKLIAAGESEQVLLGRFLLPETGEKIVELCFVGGASVGDGGFDGGAEARIGVHERGVDGVTDA